MKTSRHILMASAPCASTSWCHFRHHQSGPDIAGRLVPVEVNDTCNPETVDMATLRAPLFEGNGRFPPRITDEQPPDGAEIF